MSDFTATIRENSPRAQDWLTVLGTRTVDLKSPLPELANAPGIEAAEFYQIDLTALTPAQRERMITHLSQRFDVPREEVERDLDSVGCPILANDVTITIHNPQKWI